MSSATYQIIRRGRDWAVRVGGAINVGYATKAAAVAAATEAAKSAARRGCDVTIQVEGELGKLRLRGISGPFPKSKRPHFI
jgi:hypothetical protein